MSRFFLVAIRDSPLTAPSQVAAQGRVNLLEEQYRRIGRVLSREIVDALGGGGGGHHARVCNKGEYVGINLRKRSRERHYGADACMHTCDAAVGGTGEIVGDDKNAMHQIFLARVRERAALRCHRAVRGGASRLVTTTHDATNMVALGAAAA